MAINGFIVRHPVFTLQEITDYLQEKGSVNIETRKKILDYHRRQGRILQVRRELYCAVPSGVAPDQCIIDPFLIASRMTDDSIIAYHTALEFYGKAHSVFEQYFYLTVKRSQSFIFHGHEFCGIKVQKKLREKQQESFGVNTVDRKGIDVRVTSMERTLVDILDRPKYGGSWEEIWRSLGSVEYFDLDLVIQYAMLLENATTSAKLGFFLEQHRGPLMVTESHLQTLRGKIPKNPHYVMRGSKKPAQLVKGWNLIVPEEIINLSWQEVQ